MIPANHTRWAQWIFHHYVLRLMRSHFHHIILLGEKPVVTPDHPVLLLPNHSSWWDGFFIYLINVHLFQRRIFLMMLEKQLQKYRFFAKVGAFGIASGNPKQLLQALNYSLEVLQQHPQCLFCLFPQGELQPWGKRPLQYKRGLAWLVSRLEQPVTLLPLGVKIEFLNEQQPDVFFLFGKPVIVDDKKLIDINEMQQNETGILDDLNQRIIARETGQILLDGQTSINIFWDELRTRLKR